jgi:hypothetical protein
MTAVGPIWVVDEVVTRPGMGPAFLKAYMERYAPGAMARGMTLAHKMVEPAMWLDDASNTVLLIWSLPDVGATWGAKHMARGHADVRHWWDVDAPEFILSRRRSTLADADALKGLDDV